MKTTLGCLAITQVEFNTTILHSTSINPLCASFPHSRNTSHLHKDILSLFIIPIKTSIECRVEHSEVQTKVSLIGCFPFDIIITELVTFKSTWQLTTTIFIYSIVTNIYGVTRNVRNLLITSCSPRCSKL